MASKDKNPEADREPDNWEEGGNKDNSSKSYRDYVQQSDEESKTPKKKKESKTNK